MDHTAVRLSSARVTYPNGTRALDGIDLDIGTGERVALVGPSGAGKSTLLNLLNGRVALDGARVDGVVECSAKWSDAFAAGRGDVMRIESAWSARTMTS